MAYNVYFVHIVSFFPYLCATTAPVLEVHFNK